MHEKIIILDFGSQYTQLIARRVRELNIYCEILPYNKVPELTEDVKSVILSGSPFSVLQKEALQIDIAKIIEQKPVLAVCYGAQYLAKTMGGLVAKSDKREYGRANIHIKNESHIFFKDIPQGSQVWMSHADTILELSDKFEILADTENINVAAYKGKDGAFNKW